VLRVQLSYLWGEAAAPIAIHRSPVRSISIYIDIEQRIVKSEVTLTQSISPLPFVNDTPIPNWVVGELLKMPEFVKTDEVNVGLLYDPELL
jgi:hypothetical protein